MEWKPDIYATAFIAAGALAIVLVLRSGDWRLQVVGFSIVLIQNVGWLIDPAQELRIDTIFAVLLCFFPVWAAKDLRDDEIALTMYPPWWLVPVSLGLGVIFITTLTLHLFSHDTSWLIMNIAYAIQLAAIIVTSIRRIVAPDHQFAELPDIAELER